MPTRLDQERERCKRQGVLRAQQTRGSLGLGRGPIGDLFSLIERHGVFLVRFPSGSPALHAFFAMLDSTPVIYVNSEETLGRQHFSVAHEFCHYLYDRSSTKEVVCNPGVPAKDSKEMIADSFAAEFLLPQEGVRCEYTLRFGIDRPTERGIVKLMHDFRVSYHAMAFSLYGAGLFGSVSEYRKLRDLGKLESKEQLRALIGRLGFGTALVDPSEPACPQRFLEAVLANYSDGIISLAKLRSLLRLWNKKPEDYGMGQDEPS